MMKIKLIAIITGIFLVQGLMAQSSLSLDLTSSKLSIFGTSTIHDWEIKVNQFEGYFDGVVNGSYPEISEGKLTCKVSSFKSYKKSMDKVVYEAMKEDKFPNLTFEYTETVKKFMKDGLPNVVVKGKLTIAGTTKIVELTLQGNTVGGKVRLKGRKSFKMTDFNIDPPTAMFGTIKSGDEITIDFDIKFS
jgi:polyisoprenoid-binding protein YceI